MGTATHGFRRKLRLTGAFWDFRDLKLIRKAIGVRNQDILRSEMTQSGTPIMHRTCDRHDQVLGPERRYTVRPTVSPHCIDCAYEIDPALGRAAKCPECGRTYDLARRETYGPVEAELSKVSWPGTLGVLLVGAAVGGATSLVLDPILVIGLLIPIAAGVLAECRRMWVPVLRVLAAVHIVAFLAILLSDLDVGLAYLFGAPGLLMMPMGIGFLMGRACVLLLAPRP